MTLPILNLPRRKAASLARRLGFMRARPLSAFPELVAQLETCVSNEDKTEAMPDLSRAVVVAIRDGGQLNWLILAGGRRRISTRIVLFAGARGNIMVLGHRSDPPREVRFEGSRNIAVIGDDIQWGAVSLRFVSNEAVIALGHGSIFNGTSIIVEGDGCGASIGREGLFAPGTTVRNSDLHGIYDIETGAWLNPPRQVVIEPHVWLGQDALVLKGAVIGGGAIIGARSIVSRTLPRFAISAGAPAKPVREGICWSLDRKPSPDDWQRVSQMLDSLHED